ncbi:MULTISPECIES: hypothetical protein [Cyanophyceae]|uniref:hypothetical protein n=1 Tax=Cyanophyceae TaxID=3028117 RepID=UPI00168A2912|nr:hypothetical protein [Trichocoleus sp. FACHB-69]MBD1930385.1 hypothetical protein [Trichocoleus sp. FACHB-69]
MEKIEESNSPLPEDKAEAQTSNELSTEELEAVAGGGLGGIIAGAVIGGVVGAASGDPGVSAKDVLEGAAAGAGIGGAITGPV